MKISIEEMAIALSENGGSVVGHHGSVFLKGCLGEFCILWGSWSSISNVFRMSGVETLLIRSVLDQGLCTKLKNKLLFMRRIENGKRVGHMRRYTIMSHK